MMQLVPEEDPDQRGISMRANRVTAAELQELMRRLNTSNASEVVRRSIRLHLRLIMCEKVEIVEDGERVRVFVD
jgi:hypothetical protein